MFERPILITGGAGFIGSHLTDALLARDYRVRVLDNLSTGKRDSLPLNDERIEPLEDDTADTVTLAAALKDCAAVAHLAAVVPIQASVNDPVATHQGNFIATLNLCGAMREQGMKRVVFASSAVVYGQNDESTAIDEDTPKSPLTPYASDKLASEYYLDFCRRQHGLEPAIFRFSNVCGPHRDPSSPYSGVISIFTKRTLKGMPITVFGDDEQTRNLVYVINLVDFLIQVLEVTAVKPGTVNVGLNRSINLKQLLAEIGQVLGDLPPVTHADARAGDIRYSRADNERLLRRFRFDQPTPMDVSLMHLPDR